MCVRTLTEIFDEVIADAEKQLAAARRVKIDKGEIVISLENGTYEIPLDQCDTVDGAINWLFHVHEKTWMDEYLFMAIAAKMQMYDRQRRMRVAAQENDL